MSETNKAILEKGNAAIMQGDNEGFLSLCTEDTVWTFVGDRTLRGKEEVRQYMIKTYRQPPKFNVIRLIAEDEFVTAFGSILLKDETDKEKNYMYCDIWRFRDDKMHELTAFVIEPEQ